MPEERIKAEIIGCGYENEEYFDEIFEMVVEEVYKNDFILCESNASSFSYFVLDCCLDVESKYQ